MVPLLQNVTVEMKKESINVSVIGATRKNETEILLAM